MTFSITARCYNTGAFGVAISSSSIAVASRCVWAGPFGAVTTQNYTNPALGPVGLNLLRQGHGASATLNLLLMGDPEPEWRQVAVIDRYGQVSTHSGARSSIIANVSKGNGAVAMGNLLRTEEVTNAMIQSFGSSGNLPFAERLLTALEAGIAAGGETEPVRSAGLLICNNLEWPQVDLRVDWNDAPVGKLRELWEIYSPQEQLFVHRATDPSKT